MRLPKFYIKVFGCQMNQSDAERIATILEEYNFKPAASIDAADFVVFVTCGVRQSAEDRVYGQINNIKKKYPVKKVILTGCLAHRKDVQRRLKGKVDLFFRINDINKIEKKIKSEFYCVRKNIKPDIKIDLQNNIFFESNANKLPCNDYLKIIPNYSSRYSACVPIMTGCNNFCAYCVVPYARGREYSRSAQDILKEVKNLVKKEYKEIVLLGQNVNSYNSNLSHSKLFRNSKFKIQNSGEINFAKLLKLIESSVPGKYWLTFLTSHPKDMSDELIETIANSKKICEYISLPAQSGDNEILQRMNRNYTIEHYKNLIQKIRAAHKKLNPPPLPEGRCPLKFFEEKLGRTEGWELPPTISTDIIVGFPGETKKQFENTAKLLREMKFDMAYIAQYSPRPETAAWRLKDSVSKKEKARREKVLTEILIKTALANNKKNIGKTVEILVDKKLFPKTGSWRFSRSGLGITKYLAHTRTQKKVVFASTKKISVGSFVKVKITKAKAFGLEGEIKEAIHSHE